jgi:hypothetical protein
VPTHPFARLRERRQGQPPAAAGQTGRPDRAASRVDSIFLAEGMSVPRLAGLILLLELVYVSAVAFVVPGGSAAVALAFVTTFFLATIISRRVGRCQSASTNQPMTTNHAGDLEANEMSSTLVLADDHDTSYMTTRKIRLRDRLAGRWRSLTLDRALAQGTSPDSDAALALRAQALIGQPVRRDLANQIRRIILDAHRPSRARWRAVIISHRVVLDVELDFRGSPSDSSLRTPSM